MIYILCDSYRVDYEEHDTNIEYVSTCLEDVFKAVSALESKYMNERDFSSTQHTLYIMCVDGLSGTPRLLDSNMA